jgi:predicted AAA+ superfamily ATPase
MNGVGDTFALFDRWYLETLQKKLTRPFVHILFGARQTGKSTLLNSILPSDSLRINLAVPGERSLHLSQPDTFSRMCLALPAKGAPHTVFVDEAQNVPHVFDAVQSLYDADKRRWRFVLCGSSARRLRHSGANLLPGRCFMHHLYPMITAEQSPPYPVPAHVESPLHMLWTSVSSPRNPFPAWDIEERLAFGALPGIVTADVGDRPDLLRAFASTYLEEEIRREALVKDWGAFLRFLQLAARESGNIINYTTISRETGLSLPTVKSHYQLLEDMFIGFTVSAFSGSPRKNLLSTPRFCFFDLGVRNAAADLTPGYDTVRCQSGSLFEQWIGIELWKRLKYKEQGRLLYMRTEDGAEVDFVIELGERLIPIEVKWTEHPSEKDARHLRTFMRENPKRAPKGYVICRCPRPIQLDEHILALPWFCL